MTVPLSDILWCKQMWSMLADGGTWGVPRSGLVFQRSGDVLRLRDRMPYTEDMPITEAQLREQQDADFNVIRQRFHAAGIPVFGEEE